MSGFDTTWLDLREPADHAARDADLLEAAREFLRAGGSSPLAVDLGSGTGSTLRAFGPDGQTRWRLVDYDPRLLEAAVSRLEGFRQVERMEADLAHLDPAVVADARLVTASALFDLASQELVERVADLLAERKIGLYAALNYDGVNRWEPRSTATTRCWRPSTRIRRRTRVSGRRSGRRPPRRCAPPSSVGATRFASRRPRGGSMTVSARWRRRSGTVSWRPSGRPDVSRRDGSTPGRRRAARNPSALMSGTGTSSPCRRPDGRPCQAAARRRPPMA